MVVGGSCVPGNGNTRLKQIAFVGLIFQRDPQRHRLQALEAGRRLEMRTLFTAMQRRSALGAFAFPVNIGRKRGGAVKAASRHNVLKQPGKARAGDVDGRPGARRFGPVGELAVSGPTVGVHIAPLSVLTVVVHLLNRLLDLALSQRYLFEVFGTGPLLVSLRIDAEDSCGNRLKLERHCPACA